jgi:putative peptidoglycan lipid II flippase
MRVPLALRMNGAIAWISAIHLAVNVVLNAWFSSFLGVAGIALSTSAVYGVSCGLLWLTTRRRLVQQVLDQKMGTTPPAPGSRL